jgi:hypothetical protein
MEDERKDHIDHAKLAAFIMIVVLVMALAGYWQNQTQQDEISRLRSKLSVCLAGK